MAALLKIGIFDSGIGGLTVARAIEDTLPGFSFVYFGDTAHLPYGEKSPQLIRHYASRISHHLLDWGSAIIVVACNSASSNALASVQDAVGPAVPVIDVISPVVLEVEQAQKRFPERPIRVGVIGTRATIDSGVYQQALKAVGAQVKSRATPLLASAIEEGFAEGQVSEALLAAYLGDGYFADVDVFVLGCTHYPLIADQIQAYLSPDTRLLDSPALVARAVSGALGAAKATLPEDQESVRAFFVSDLTPAFAAGARRFFGEAVELSERSIWGDQDRNPSA